MENLNPSELAEFVQLIRAFTASRAQAPSIMPAPPLTATPIAPPFAATGTPQLALSQLSVSQPIATGAIQPIQAPTAIENQRPAPEPPIAQRYPGARATLRPVAIPAAYEPFMGSASLAPAAGTFNTTHVNQARMRSAQATNPRNNPGSHLIRRRARGPAIHTPSLSRRPRIEHCLVEGAATPTVRIRILVYPPMDPDSRVQTYYAYRMLAVDFHEVLQRHGLAFDMELPLSTLVNGILADLVVALGHSPSCYIFPTPRRASASTTTAVTALQYLSLVGKGRPSRNQVRLKMQPTLATMTIGDMAADCNRFLSEDCIQDGRFVMRVVATAFPLIRLQDNRQHTCISDTIYSLFPRDGAGMGPDPETSGGESVSEEEEEEEEVLYQLARPPNPRARRALRAPPSPIARPLREARHALREIPAYVPSHAITPTEPAFSNAGSPPPSRLVMPSFSLPSAIWQTSGPAAYNAQPPHPESMHSPNQFATTVFRLAAQGQRPSPILSIRAYDLDAAADRFLVELDDAASREDYSTILAPERTIALSRGGGSAVGVGPEREVITHLFKRYIPSQWFEPVAGSQFVSFRPLLPIESAAHTPLDRLRDAERLGAIIGLFLVYGQYPSPLVPTLIQYMIHHGILASLDLGFMREWLPQETFLLEGFKAAGHTLQDLTQFRSLFVTYLDIDPAAYRFRSEATHKALVVQLLLKIALGCTAFNHPELQRIYRGFCLPCPNGFNLPDTLRNFEGGSGTFISLVNASYISNTDAILPLLVHNDPSNVNVHLANLRALTGDATMTFQSLVEAFLRGTGTPCPTQFADFVSAIHPIVDLSQIDAPGFRSQVFSWAATGSPFVDPAGGPSAMIHIGPVDSREEAYGEDNSLATLDRLVADGTFWFRTCLRMVRYPVEHVLQLAREHYNPASEPANFQDAFDFWFLQQCLLGIGRFNML